MKLNHNSFISFALLLTQFFASAAYSSEDQVKKFLKTELNYPIADSCGIIVKQQHDPSGPFEKTELCNEWEYQNLKSVKGKVYRVVDGDTIHFYVNKKLLAIRMLGIDTPELHFKSMAQPKWGDTAKDSLRSMVAPGDTITLQLDQVKCDRYGRILGHVYKDKVNLNFEQVRRGYAANYCIAPNLKHCEAYSMAYEKAAQENLGIHTDSCSVTPYVWRRAIAGEKMDKKVKDNRNGQYYSPSDYYLIPVAYRVFYPN